MVISYIFLLISILATVAFRQRSAHRWCRPLARRSSSLLLLATQQVLQTKPATLGTQGVCTIAAATVRRRRYAVFCMLCSIELTRKQMDKAKVAGGGHYSTYSSILASQPPCRYSFGVFGLAAAENQDQERGCRASVYTR